MSAASSLASGFIISIMNPFITFIAATEPIDVGASTAERGPTSLVAETPTPFGARVVSQRRRPSMVAAEYGSPPEIAGHADAGVGLYDPRSAFGRPLTADDGARNRA
jgi:hypothetical protein